MLLAMKTLNVIDAFRSVFVTVKRSFIGLSNCQLFSHSIEY